MKPNADQPNEIELEYRVIAVNKVGEGESLNSKIVNYKNDVISKII